ncbi:MAG: glycosyltransferase family 2 protein [Pleurocapsa sp. CRU_1_2]|nr:glycosyltransferase family 2 protein [Pleurocapsa sp. CRU_1_2]
MSNQNQTDLDSLVSIVIPYYQHKQYIKSCIESIVNQTYANIELIVVDDCSPDGSGEYVEKILSSEECTERFSQKINFTRFEKNRGAHAAINYGIKKARGKFIAIVNSDDLFHSSRIEIMINSMRKEQKDFAFSSFICINEKGEDITQCDVQARDFAQFQEESINFPTLGFASLTGNIGISTGNFVFTKELYLLTKGFKDLKYCHDWDFLLQCLYYTEPLFVSEKLYYYRFHQSNTFKSLQEEGVHIEDTAKVLKSYFNSVRCRKTINPLAPSSFNYPNYFELFLSLNNYEDYYKKSVYI